MMVLHKSVRIRVIHYQSVIWISDILILSMTCSIRNKIHHWNHKVYLTETSKIKMYSILCTKYHKMSSYVTDGIFTSVLRDWLLGGGLGGSIVCRDEPVHVSCVCLMRHNTTQHKNQHNIKVQISPSWPGPRHQQSDCSMGEEISLGRFVNFPHYCNWQFRQPAQKSQHLTQRLAQANFFVCGCRIVAKPIVKTVKYRSFTLSGLIAVILANLNLEFSLCFWTLNN